MSEYGSEWRVGVPFFDASEREDSLSRSEFWDTIGWRDLCDCVGESRGIRGR
jgi:hypothetical protein